MRLLQQVEGRRAVARVGHNMGQFALSWSGLQAVGIAPVKCFHNVATERNGCRVTVVFEVKKENPANSTTTAGDQLIN